MADSESGRYGFVIPPSVRTASQWSLSRVGGPAALIGANGISFGPDNQLYVAQAYGSEISAVMPESGVVRTICRTDDPITCPDDIAFGADGTMYIAEMELGRVSARDSLGELQVIDSNVPDANGIATSGDRLFIGQFRPDGCIFELFRDGQERRLVADGLQWPNGMSVGADGRLYFPSVLAGEIWSVDLDGGVPHLVVSGLSAPVAVKATPDGNIVTTEAAGSVLTIDPRTGTTTTLAKLAPGLDNCAFGPDGSLFVSNMIDGRITQITTQGVLRDIVQPGFIGPMGLDVSEDGTLYVADAWSYAAVQANGPVERLGTFMDAGFPGVLRSLALADDGSLLLATTAGTVVKTDPRGEHRTLATDLGDVVGLAATADGAVYVAESSEGRLVRIDRDGVITTVASGLARPMGVAAAADGSLFVVQGDAGSVSRVDGRGVSIVIDGLEDPHGLAVNGSDLYVVARGSRSLHHLSLESGESTVIADNLPIGGGPGVTPKVVAGLPPNAPGPWMPFNDLAASPDGSVFVGCDGDGSVLRLVRRDDVWASATGH
ncbi:gluconolaconase [Rhodococcus sp. NPDC056960]|uniref:virginiamycin B lyase family protein n=1 Tax=Rhodococcus TaxID=1827 RepID=UPI003625705B